MLKVLIVDDEVPVHEALRIMLDWETLGYATPDDAMDGEEALRMMRNAHYDVVLTDIRMPRMDGLAFMRTLRDIRADVQIIVITGYDAFSYAQEALRCGARDYFLKPIDRHTVRRRMEALADELKRQSGEASGAVGICGGSIDEAVAYVDHCFRHEIGVRDLAELMHMNAAYVGQQFRKATGMTLNDYVNRKRVDWVKHMVLREQMPVQEAIAEAGYRSSGHFYRKFQEIEGRTFAEWRQEDVNTGQAGGS